MKRWLIILLIFIVVIIILISSTILWYLRGTKMKLSDNDVDDLYHLTDYTNRLLIYHQIPYAICGGTLLGSVRDRGLIPWDHDVDIIVMNDYREKLKNISKTLPKEYNLKFDYGNRSEMLTPTIYYKNVHIDIWLFEKVNNRLTDSNPENCKSFPTSWFYYQEFYPLRSYRFGPLTLLGPNQYEPYLNRVYGSNWRYPSHYQSKKDIIFCLLWAWINKLRSLKTKCRLPSNNFKIIKDKI